MKRRDKSLLYACLATAVFPALLFCSCAGGKNTATTVADDKKGKPYCSSVPVQAAAPAVNWYKAQGNKDEVTAAFKLPSAYDVYETDSATLSAFFVYANNHNEKLGISLPLPGALGCQPFLAAVTATMADGLKGEYPDIASLKGNSPNETGADLRLNYGNKQMNASVAWNGSTYIVAPALVKGHTIYIVYDKENAAPEAIIKKYEPRVDVIRQGGLQTSDR